MAQRATVPRGRHAPPLEVRLSVQRRRLFSAAADVFARVGYADASAEAIAPVLDVENQRGARAGLVPRFASPHDPFAVVGAAVELASRQIRLGVPEDIRDLEPLLDRLASGLLAAPEPVE